VDAAPGPRRRADAVVVHWAAELPGEGGRPRVLDLRVREPAVDRHGVAQRSRVARPARAGQVPVRERPGQGHCRGRHVGTLPCAGRCGEVAAEPVHRARRGCATWSSSRVSALTARRGCCASIALSIGGGPRGVVGHLGQHCRALAVPMPWQRQDEERRCAARARQDGVAVPGCSGRVVVSRFADCTAFVWWRILIN
jgi:hypothetical protein